MLTFGLSGLLTLFSFGNNYVHRDYFHTPKFGAELHQFAQYLNMFELNSTTLEKEKQLLTVSEEDIIQYRDRLGSIIVQTESLEEEYQQRIDEALMANNQEAADIYIAERNQKIEDMTNIFKSDDYARRKVLTEKEQELKSYFEEREAYRTQFIKDKEQFRYYFTNSLTGKVYTNLSASDLKSSGGKMAPENMLYMTSYTLPALQSLDSWLQGETAVPYTGEIGIPRDLSSTSFVMTQYDQYRQEQLAFWAYIIASIAVLILCTIHAKRAVVLPSAAASWLPYYNRLPVEVRMLSFILICCIAGFSLFSIKDQFTLAFENTFVYGRKMLINWAVASVCLIMALIQAKVFAERIKDWQYVKQEWEQGLLNRARKGMRALLNRTKHSLSDAFLKKSTGVQLFVLLFSIFGLGAAAMMISLDPGLIVVYVILLAVAGLPIVLYLIGRIGYFNRIVLKTDELAAGHLGQDLKVSGQSVLAKLAQNINVLRQGVGMLQNEQAKSERLKTELITNVSHDLRTPLTSIITYTELLKQKDLANEDRLSYVDIIDRKSKRLKVLIDDLFEVSKMASGNVELVKEQIDLVQLLQQTLAEYDSMIDDSRLQFRLINAEEPVYAFVDGQKLWRVFDNLIGNILKYSLENSRAYITVQTMDNQVVITFKNVSKYEISENLDELFERFKRGDSSRHTEGSGLGLAIAKSIVDLHEGSLDIDIDGDLFKVIISLRTDVHST